MSTGNWLETHRKQVVIHASIIVVFILFLIFMAEPLFDSLERIPGEAQFHRLNLPAETRDIRFHFDEFETDGRTTAGVRGWAFVIDGDTESNRIYMVLRSSDRTYVFDTVEQTRPDVTQHFGELGLNLDHSGFRALIPVRKVADGEYTIGIYIRKGETEALQYTDRAITKLGGTVEISE